MQLYLWVAIAIVVVAIVGFAAYWSRGRRSRRLRARFGPEYNRTVKAAGDERRAEEELAAREERRRRFQVRELEPAERTRYQEAWQVVQAHFVDEPGTALREANVLVNEVMKGRGYPMDDFEQSAADISVDHPHEVEDYRTAHSISASAARQEAGTEDLRRGMQHYRALFASLLGEASPNHGSEPAAHTQPESAQTRTEGR